MTAPIMQRIRVTINVSGPGKDPVFEALTHGDRWNGWAVPAFERAEAERVVEWINATDDAENPDGVSAHWDGDTVIVINRSYADEEDGGVDRYDGPLYAIGAMSWTWEVVE